MLDKKDLKSIADLLNSQTNMILNKLENENTSLLLQMIKDLQKEVEELKKKIA